MNSETKSKQSKAIDMRFYWLTYCQQAIETIENLLGTRGKTNLVDYFTNHHSPMHHKTARPIYYILS